MHFKGFEFTVKGNTHRARRAFNHRLRRMAVRTMKTRKLFKTGMEDLLCPAQGFATALAFLIQTGKLNTGPEFIFKRFCLTGGGIQYLRTLNDDRPRRDREAHQDKHNQLNQDAGL